MLVGSESFTIDHLKHITPPIQTSVLADSVFCCRFIVGVSLIFELRRMARFAQTFESSSATVYRLGGKTAVKLAQQTTKASKKSIKLAATFGKDGLTVLDKVGGLKFTKLVSRASKMTYKGDIFRLIAKLLLLFTTWVLYFFVALGVVIWIPWRFLTSMSKSAYQASRQFFQAK